MNKNSAENFFFKFPAFQKKKIIEKRVDIILNFHALDFLISEAKFVVLYPIFIHTLVETYHINRTNMFLYIASF